MERFEHCRTCGMAELYALAQRQLDATTAMLEAAVADARALREEMAALLNELENANRRNAAHENLCLDAALD